MKALLGRIPFLLSSYGRLSAAYFKARTPSVLHQLKGSDYAVAQSIHQSVQSFLSTDGTDQGVWIEAIEKERARQLETDALLNDGTLGEDGLYARTLTIAGASRASKPADQARWLFHLVLATQPKCVIELGTNTGISSAYIGAAMRMNGVGGQFLTLDASPYRQREALKTHQSLHLDNVGYVRGLFSETLTPSLERLGSVDLAFIDGHHQYQSTLDYFEEILKFSNPQTIFLFDDIRWSAGMKKAWAEIQQDRRLGLVVDLAVMGLAVQAQNDRQALSTDRIQLFE